MSRARRHLISGCVFALWLFCSGGANAQESSVRVTARKLGYSGVEAFQHGSYGLASERLEKAFATLRAPSLGLWSARALEKLGRLVDAARRYREISSLDPTEGDPIVQRKAQGDAVTELKTLMQRMPNIVLIVEGSAPTSPVTVELDQVTLPSTGLGKVFPTDPGTHRVVARDGDRTVEQTFAVHEFERKNIVLHFETSAQELDEAASKSATSRSLQRTLGWVAVGVGGAAILTSAVLGTSAMKKKAKAGNGNCNMNPCGPNQVGGAGSGDSLRTLSTVGFVVGLVSAGTGAVLLLTLPKKTSPRVSAWIGLDGVGVAGSF